MENKKWRGHSRNLRFETKSAKWRWGPEVVAAQWPCPAQGCPWGLDLDGD